MSVNIIVSMNETITKPNDRAIVGDLRDKHRVVALHPQKRFADNLKIPLHGIAHKAIFRKALARNRPGDVLDEHACLANVVKPLR